MPDLRLLDVVVALLQQLLDDVLDVLADVAGFGQRRGVGDGERHVEHARQRFGQQRLARAGRADQQDVGLATARCRRSSGATRCACSGCTPPPTASSWRAAGRSRTGRATSRISRGLGRCERAACAFSSSSSRMMSLHSSTHSSQMNTLGPAISLRTSCWLLPQKEQYRILLLSPERLSGRRSCCHGPCPEGRKTGSNRG